MINQCAYSSSDPEVLAGWNRYIDQEKAYRVFCAKFKEDMRGERELFSIESALSGVKRIVGITMKEGERDDPPPGWKVNRKHHYLEPRLGSREGRAIEAMLSDAVVRRPEFPGMPMKVWQGLGVHSPEICEFRGVVYVHWQVDCTIVEATERLDPEVWKHLTLGEYYADMEIKEAEESRDEG